MIICSYFNFKAGGLEKHVYHLVRGLLKHDVKITLITAYKDPYTHVTIPSHRGDKLTIIPLKYFVAPFNNPLMPSLLNVITKLDEPDVVHVHDHYFYGSMISPILKKIIKRPLVLTIHTSKLRYNNFLKNLIVDIYDNIIGKIIFKTADKVIAVTRTTVYELVKYGVPQEKVIYIPNFLTVDSQEDYDKKMYNYIRHIARFKILYVGRLVFRKGLHILLHAFDIALRNGSIPRDSVLIIVGKGHLESYIRKMITVNPNLQERVMLLGTVSDDVLRALYKASDVVVLPSISGETTSLVIQEAIFFEKPFIASLIGGIRDYVLDGFWGFYIPPGDVLALEKSLNKIYNLITKKPSFVQKKLQQNRERLLQTRSSENVISKVLQVYNEVVSNLTKG
ncbi:MAG: glycosyltransferase family 4 protein [Thermofilaceae archaeon]